MEEKALLISSMEKLINHIVVSRRNQEEIFASLSKNDFRKIISNLEDQNLRLRKISLALITQMLHNNPALKEKFCHIMNVPLVPGRVAFNTKLCPSSTVKANLALEMAKNIKEVYAMLKQPLSQKDKGCLFWFVNYNVTPLRLQDHPPPQGQSLNINELMDPLDCMVGFVLGDRPVAEVEAPRKRSEVQNSTKMYNNYFRPMGRQKTGQPVNQTISHGYNTDRQVNYAPRTTVNSKQTNVSVNFNQQKQDGSDPRGKYQGIKIVTQASTRSQNPTARYFEEQRDPTSRVAGFNNSPTLPNTANQTIGVARERGYDSLRQKKVIEKYPM